MVNAELEGNKPSSKEAVASKSPLRNFFLDLGIKGVFATVGNLGNVPGFPDRFVTSHKVTSLNVWKEKRNAKGQREMEHPKLIGLDGTNYVFTGTRYDAGVTTVEMSVGGLQTEYTVLELRIRLKNELDAKRKAREKEEKKE